MSRLRVRLLTVSAAALLTLPQFGCLYVQTDEEYRIGAARGGVDARLSSLRARGTNRTGAPDRGTALPSPSRVALLTDYGTADEYVAILKGAILREEPHAPIIDLTHEAPSYDIADGDYLLTEIAREFPADTVFVAIVDPGVGTTRRAMAMQTSNGMWFVGPDNGLFTGVMDAFGIESTWEIVRTPGGRERSDTFHGRDLFAPIAGMLVAGRDIGEFVEPLRDPVRLPPVEPAGWTGAALTGAVLRADKYGNLLTNIPASLAAERAGLRPDASGNARVRVTMGAREIEVPFARTYGDVARGEAVLVINSRGNLELAINEGNAAESFNMRNRAPIRVSPLR